MADFRKNRSAGSCPISALSHRPSLLAVWRAVAAYSCDPNVGAPVQEKKPRSFREVLVRVMAMQVVTLALLGLLQYRYGR